MVVPSPDLHHLKRNGGAISLKVVRVAFHIKKVTWACHFQFLKRMRWGYHLQLLKTMVWNATFTTLKEMVVPSPHLHHLKRNGGAIYFKVVMVAFHILVLRRWRWYPHLILLRRWGIPMSLSHIYIYIIIPCSEG